MLKEFKIKEIDRPEQDHKTVAARNAEEAGQIVLGKKVTRHPGGRTPLIAKAYSQGDGGLTMVRLYEAPSQEQ